jgi:hypothetical protein
MCLNFRDIVEIVPSYFVMRNKSQGAKLGSNDGGRSQPCLLVAKNSCSDGVLPPCHGELAGSCATIILGIFGGLS